MDERDFRILVELHRDPFTSGAKIAKLTGVPARTVATRVERLRRCGIFRDLFLVPHAACFGRHERVHIFENVPQGDADQYAELDDVVWAARNHPNLLVLTTYARAHAMEPPKALVERVPGKFVMTATSQAPLSASEGSLSRIEWRLARAILDHPRASIANQARAAGLAPKTAARHRADMRRRGLLPCAMDVDSSREPGRILFALYARARDTHDLARIRGPGLYRIMNHETPPGAYVLGLAQAYPDVASQADRVRALPGIDQVEVTIPEGAHLNRDRVRAWIDERIHSWPGNVG